MTYSGLPKQKTTKTTITFNERPKFLCFLSLYTVETQNVPAFLRFHEWRAFWSFVGPQVLLML